MTTNLNDREPPKIWWPGMIGLALECLLCVIIFNPYNLEFIDAFNTLIKANIIAILIGGLTIYTAFYAITWAQYEFHSNRQRQQISIIAALMSTENRIQFAPQLAQLTREKSPIHPTWFSFRHIVNAIFSKNNQKYCVYNQNIISDAANLIKSFKDWTHADFSSINLPHGYLHGVILAHTWLNNADLSHTKLSKANLSYAFMHEANLSHARLYWADLSHAHLHWANLSHAKLQDANLYQALLYETDLSQAQLYKANLIQAELAFADLNGANLSQALLRQAHMSHSILVEADLRRADLLDADLTNAILTGADLSGADLIEADLFKAKLNKAVLRGTKVEATQLAQASTLYLAELPEGIEKELKQAHPHLFEERSLFDEF